MIFLSGLSGAGKSTLAYALQDRLRKMAIPAEVFDGDVYRKTVNKDLGFTVADRRENIYRLAKLAQDKCIQGVISIIAAINPFEDQRKELVKQFGSKIIYIHCDLSRLIERDTKGLYRRAYLPGDHPEKLWNLTGVNDPYEIPLNADLVIDTSEAPVGASLEQLVNYVLGLVVKS